MDSGIGISLESKSTTMGPCVVTFVLLFLSAAVQASSEHPTEPETRIIGGTDAPDGAVPYQVSLRLPRENQHFCGGGIINDRWILTATHCFLALKESDIVAVVGTNSLSSGGTKYAIEKIVRSNFNRTSFADDIAVIKTKTQIQFTDKVKALQLPSEDTGSGVVCLLSGWGRYDNNKWTLPDHLQWLNVTTIPLSECQNKLKKYERTNPITEKQICTFNKEGEGFCQGDSGGVLVRDNTAVGVVSTGVPCARGYPDVYARVYKYLDFIHDAIDNYS